MVPLNKLRNKHIVMTIREDTTCRNSERFPAPWARYTTSSAALGMHCSAPTSGIPCCTADITATVR